MTLPDTWHTPLAVLGLLLGLLLAAALVRRYQEYKAYQRARLSLLLSQVRTLEQALERLARIPISHDLRAALRGHLARQYEAIQGLHRAYPDIRRLTEEARQRVESDGGAYSGQVPAIPDQTEYVRLLGAIDALTGLLSQHGKALTPSSSAPGDWLRELRERRAEITTRYLTVEAHRAQSKGDCKRAGALLGSLMTQLRDQGPDTGFIRELYAQAREMRTRALRRQPLLDGEPGPDQRSNRSSAA